MNHVNSSTNYLCVILYSKIGGNASSYRHRVAHTSTSHLGRYAEGLCRSASGARGSQDCRWWPQALLEHHTCALIAVAYEQNRSFPACKHHPHTLALQASYLNLSHSIAGNLSHRRTLQMSHHIAALSARSTRSLSWVRLSDGWSDLPVKGDSACPNPRDEKEFANELPAYVVPPGTHRPCPTSPLARSTSVMGLRSALFWKCTPAPPARPYGCMVSTTREQLHQLLK